MIVFVAYEHDERASRVARCLEGLEEGMRHGTGVQVFPSVDAADEWLRRHRDAMIIWLHGAAGTKGAYAPAEGALRLGEAAAIGDGGRVRAHFAVGVASAHTRNGHACEREGWYERIARQLAVMFGRREISEDVLPWHAGSIARTPD